MVMGWQALQTLVQKQMLNLGFEGLQITFEVPNMTSWYNSKIDALYPLNNQLIVGSAML